MLTIKTVDEFHNEHVIETKEVSTLAAQGYAFSDMIDVLYRDNHEEWKRISDGEKDIYIMNESGKTIANYHYRNTLSSAEPIE